MKGDISYEDYFEYLREEVGTGDKKMVDLLEKDQKTKPENVKKFLESIVGITDPTAKTAFILFAKEGMTAEKSGTEIASLPKKTTPRVKTVPLGKMGRVNWNG